MIVNLYPGKPHLNKAAVILGSMSSDMVSDIIALVNERGAGLQSDLFSPNSEINDLASVRFLNVFSNEFITDTDFPDVWVGFSAVAMSSFKKPTMSHDFYQDVLENTFNLPAELARPIADKVETWDPLNKPDDAWIHKMGSELLDAARRGLNVIGGAMNLEIDQSQDYDFDNLYELKIFGAAIQEFASRARLMSSQALIKAQTGLFNYGDPGDSQSADAAVGRALKPYALRNIPRKFYGGGAAIASIGAKASRINLQNLIDRAGMTKAGSTLVSSGNGDPGLEAALKGVLGLAPGKMALAQAIMGNLSAKLTKIFNDSPNATQSGDPNAADYIADMYGDVVASALRRGDPKPFHEQMIRDMTTPYLSGDPMIDDAILQEIGDAGRAIETGNPLTQFRLNIKRRQAAGRLRRRTRGSNRIDRRMNHFNEIQSARANNDQDYTQMDNPSDIGSNSGDDYQDEDYSDDYDS